MGDYREWVGAMKTAVAVGRKQHVTVTAAGLGYYAFNSLVPLLLLVTLAVSIAQDPSTTADGVELYGIAGAVLLVLTWLYLGGLILLFRCDLQRRFSGAGRRQ